MKFITTLASLVIFTLISVDVFAEVARRDNSGAAAAKAQLLLRQIAADRDALQAENAKLQQEIDSLQKKLDKLKSEKTRLSKKINRADQAIDKYDEVNRKLRDRINHDRERTRELITRFKETVNTLKQVETQRSELNGELIAVSDDLNTCAKNNVNLYNTNLELVELYKEKSFWDALKQKEPVTQLGRVEIENIGQRYTNKMQEFRFASNLLEE